MKPGIEPATPDLQGERFIHYTTVAPDAYHVKIMDDYIGNIELGIIGISH